MKNIRKAKVGDIWCSEDRSSYWALILAVSPEGVTYELHGGMYPKKGWTNMSDGLPQSTHFNEFNSTWICLTDEVKRKQRNLPTWF